jgi:hypothetical protein
MLAALKAREERKGPMDTKQAPDAWIGQQVQVGLDTSQQVRAGVGPSGESEPLGILEAMNENGLVLLQRVEEGNRPVFYPWRLIAWVYPKEEQVTEEEQKSEAIPRPTEVPGPSYYRDAH